MTAYVITGMHRTGTSMVAKSLWRAGLRLGDKGDFIDPAPDNPEGFFEHAGFVRLADDLLESTGGAWDHPPTCPPLSFDDHRVDHLEPRARELIDALAVDGPWGWKDPRACLLARYWLDLLPDARFVVCVRNPLEVALSLKQRNRVSYAHGLGLWTAYYRALLDAVPAEEMVFTHYDAHFVDQRAEMMRLLSFVGLPEDQLEHALPARNEHLRHQRIDVSLHDAGLSDEMMGLYGYLCERSGFEDGRAGDAASGAQVRREVVDLASANRLLEQRARQIRSLERQLDKLVARVARRRRSDREIGRAALEQQTSLDAVVGRLDRLEDAVQAVAYQVEDLGSRPDRAVVAGCRDLVRRRVERHASVLVVARGDTALLDLYGRTATNFPQDDDGVYPGFTPAHGQAAVAHLEALRAKGATHLLVPETSRWWLDHFAPFAEHLACRYAVVEDRPQVGVLIDLRRRRPTTAGWSQSLNVLLDRIAAAGGSPPAVLDWTDLDLAQRLPGRNLFVPPTPSDILPYLDRTIDVVVVDAHRPAPEARRVAAGAVVTIAGDRTGTHRIVDVEVIAPVLRSATEPAVAVIVGGSVAHDPGAPPLEDRQALDEALAGEDDVECFEAPTGELPPEALGADIVALVEPGVVPLPGCITAARTALASDDDLAAVAVKLFAPDGSVEAAGATVFADGSIRGIAGGSHDACGAWHEYVRPVCGGLGLLFLRTAAVQKLADQQRFGSAPSLGWGAALWSAGWRVRYRPEATAVRLVPAKGPATTALDPAERRAWAPALAARPDLPVALDEQAWRRILADDAVEEAWR